MIAEQQVEAGGWEVEIELPKKIYQQLARQEEKLEELPEEQYN